MKITIAFLLGAASCLVIAGGVRISLVLRRMTIVYNEGVVDSEKIYHEAVWIFGFLYIIPGIIGLIAAFVQTRKMYMTTCFMLSFCDIIIKVIFMSTDEYPLTLVINSWFDSNYCKDAANNCHCRKDMHSFPSKYQPTPFKTCAYLMQFSAVVKEYYTFGLPTLIAQAVEFALAIYYYLHSKPFAGVLIVQYQQPMLQPGPYMMPQAYGQPGIYIVPQPYGQPGPVMMPQAQNQPGPVMMPQAYSQPGLVTMPQPYGQPGPVTMPQPYSQPGPVMMPEVQNQPGPVMMSQAYSQPGSDMMSQASSQPRPNMMHQAYNQPGFGTMV